MAIYELKNWREITGFKGSLKEVAISKLANDLNYHKLYKNITHNGKNYSIHIDNPIEHPYPDKDEGIRYVDCLTDLSKLSSIELAKMLYNVDMSAINTYFNQIRRRVSILERPLVSGRGEWVIAKLIWGNWNEINST